jgi:ABC-2 type transport system permease protein
MGDMIFFAFVLQVILAVATVFGYGLIIGQIETEAARYLATGSATVALMMIGLVLAPQMVTTAKQEGSLDWLRTLPMPRWVFFAADTLLWSAVAVPGVAIGVAIGAWHFGVTLAISPWVIVAVPLVATIAATVGYALALLVQPQLVQLITQVVVFIVLLFSPVSFPANRLPAWLYQVHQWLPIAPIADLVRAALISDVFHLPLRSIVVLAVWTVAALVGVIHALNKKV